MRKSGCLVLNLIMVESYATLLSCGVGSGPALATSETSQVLLAGVSGGFPGVLPFRPTYLLARLDMNEIILKGTNY